MRMLIKAFLERREQESGGESSEADNLQLIKWVLEAIKPNWPHLYEWTKKLSKEDQHTDVIEWVDDMAATSEEFLKMANGVMQDYTRFRTEKSEKSTGKDKQAQDSGVKSNNQGVKFDNNAAGTSKADGKDKKKRHDPNIVCLTCDEPGHIARYCTNKGKPAVTYPRSASQQGDRGGGKGSEGGKGKGEKKGSVAAVAAETTDDEWEEFPKFKEFKANKSTRAKPRATGWGSRTKVECMIRMTHSTSPRISANTTKTWKRPATVTKSTLQLEPSLGLQGLNLQLRCCWDLV
jgi:hypothetical protein